MNEEKRIRGILWQTPFPSIELGLINWDRYQLGTESRCFWGEVHVQFADFFTLCISRRI